MRSTTFAAATVFVLDEAPNQESPFRATVELVHRVTTSLSNREARRPFSATLRWSVEYESLVHGEAARRLEGVLRDLQTQPVACPIWPFLLRWADRASMQVTAGAWLVFKSDWSNWALYADGAEPGWPADDDSVVPILFGRLNRPKPRWQDPLTAVLAVDFVENSAADLAVGPLSGIEFDAGPTPSVAWTTAPRLCPFNVDFKPEQREFLVTVVRDRIGFQRQDAETLYEQTNALSFDPDFVATEQADFGRVLAFFQQHASGAAFWLPGNVAVATLTNDVLAADTELDVEDSHAVRAGDWLALQDYEQDPAFGEVASLDADTLTLTGAVGADFTSGGTLLSRLILARFERPRLVMSWLEQGVLVFAIAAKEVPEEYSPAADETLGTTLGKLPTKLYLYEFVRDYGNGTTATTRWTSYESDVEWNGYTWTSKPVSHGEIRQSLNLERESVDLTTFFSADNPLLGDVTLESEGTLSCVIRELQLTA